KQCSCAEVPHHMSYKRLHLVKRLCAFTKIRISPAELLKLPSEIDVS
ncbi:hypothetical protein GCK32_017480, partial [Trichostrongylus colubriformis]